MFLCFSKSIAGLLALGYASLQKGIERHGVHAVRQRTSANFGRWR
jgi:hypothetical protein